MTAAPLPTTGVKGRKMIMLATDRVDGFEPQLDGLKEFRFKAVLDSKDIEAIKAEQKTLAVSASVCDYKSSPCAWLWRLS